MKHYTLTVCKPEGDLRPRLENNANFLSPVFGQFVIWDGPANKRDVSRMFEIVSPYCTMACLFSGKGEKQKLEKQIGNL